MITMVEGHLISICYGGFDLDGQVKRDVIAAVRPIFKKKLEELKGKPTISRPLTHKINTRLPSPNNPMQGGAI